MNEAYQKALANVMDRLVRAAFRDKDVRSITLSPVKDPESGATVVEAKAYVSMVIESSSHDERLWDNTSRHVNAEKGG